MNKTVFKLKSGHECDRQTEGQIDGKTDRQMPGRKQYVSALKGWGGGGGDINISGVT